MNKILLAFSFLALNLVAGAEMNLNGTWDFGPGRQYAGTTTVPGLQDDAGKIASAPLWYRRQATLPGGDWKNAVLVLKGARFAPTVYVNNNQVSAANGGMSASVHPLRSAAVKPGATVTLEIALKPLSQLPKTDASYIPQPDHFRSDISTHFWDDVVLETHDDFRISRMIPFTDFKGHTVKLRWAAEKLSDAAPAPGRVQCELLGKDGGLVAEATGNGGAWQGELMLKLPANCRTWSPEDPYCYQLKLTLTTGGRTETKSIVYGFKEFKLNGLGFELNGHPYQLRGSNTPFFRFARDSEANEVEWNHDWWSTQIIQRFKRHGANYIRFHLGQPPEWLLEECDRAGLIVQDEWIFFHGMNAAETSLVEQWRPWLDTAVAHPSVCLLQLYNETPESAARRAWAALKTLEPEYPPLLMAHRDTVNPHHYWWSLFENISLTYDSPAEIKGEYGASAGGPARPAIVDEFGGDYVDGQGKPGVYAAIRGAFLRFLGPKYTSEDALMLQTLAHGRVAEYWRRLGVGGFASFCTLGSPFDGNHWFLGSLREGRPKPVWASMTVAWSPRAASLEIWDRNFLPGQKIEVPLYLFNDTGESSDLRVAITIRDTAGKECAPAIPVSEKVQAWGRVVKKVGVVMPTATGSYRLEARMLNPTPEVTEPVVSAWKVFVLKASVPERLKTLKIGVGQGDGELRDFLRAEGLTTVAWNDPAADVLAAAGATWAKLVQESAPETTALEQAWQRSKGVVLLDLSGGAKGRSPIDLVQGVRVTLTSSTEESHLQPTAVGVNLWDGLDYQSSWLWNGLRGGLIVPKVVPQLEGGGAEGFLATWKARGADEQAIRAGPCYAYALEDNYAFSRTPADESAKKQLRRKVSDMLADAPALAGRVNPQGEIQETDLHAAFNRLPAGTFNVVPLARCGQNLTQAPVLMVDRGAGAGRLIVSTLLTAGRLAAVAGSTELYGVRHDEAACQMVLNMLNVASGSSLRTDESFRFEPKAGDGHGKGGGNKKSKRDKSRTDNNSAR